MNTNTEPIAERIELLVDGELPETQRSGLFSEIETTPGGWRQCALAYAEVQVIGASLSAGEDDSDHDSHSNRRWWQVSGMAAALAAAFFAGRFSDRAEAAGGDVLAKGSDDTAPVSVPASSRGLFRSAVAEDGAPAYFTHEQLPTFMLEALVAAGHRVRLTEHKVQLDALDGKEIELPLIETQIIDMRPMAL